MLSSYLVQAGHALLHLQGGDVGGVVGVADHLRVLLLMLAQHLRHGNQRFQCRLKIKTRKM